MRLKTLTKELHTFAMVRLYQDTCYGREYIGEVAATSIGKGSDYFCCDAPDGGVRKIANLDFRKVKE